MALNLLPNELLKKILWHLDKEDTKSFASTSKRLNTVALPKLWSKPRYLNELKDLDFLKNIRHLPILEVNLVDFDIPCWLKMTEMLPNLKHVTVDRYLYCEHLIGPVDLQSFKNVPMALHTNSFKMSNKEYFGQLLEVLESCKVQEMIIDHVNYNGKDQFLWPSKALSVFVGKVNITKLYTNCFKINDRSVEDFIKNLAKFKNCRVIIPGSQNSIYQFIVGDLELMADLEIEVVSIKSSAWKSVNLEGSFVRIATALKRFEHLEEVHLDHELVIEPPRIHVFTGLPITVMSTNHVRLEGENIEIVVKTLSRIKTLKWFYIVAGLWLGGPHKLTPEEFKFFRILPVKLVHVSTLHLTKENVPVFRGIMETMEIEELEWFRNDAPPGDYQSLDISEKCHGPDGAYRTI